MDALLDLYINLSTSVMFAFISVGLLFMAAIIDLWNPSTIVNEEFKRWKRMLFTTFALLPILAFNVYNLSYVPIRIQAIQYSAEQLKSPDIEDVFQSNLSTEAKKALASLYAEQIKLNLEKRKEMKIKLENIGYESVNNKVSESREAKLKAKIQLTRDITEDQEKLNKINEIMAEL